MQTAQAEPDESNFPSQEKRTEERDQNKENGKNNKHTFTSRGQEGPGSPANFIITHQRQAPLAPLPQRPRSATRIAFFFFFFQGWNWGVFLQVSMPHPGPRVHPAGAHLAAQFPSHFFALLAGALGQLTFPAAQHLEGFISPPMFPPPNKQGTLNFSRPHSFIPSSAFSFQSILSA